MEPTRTGEGVRIGGGARQGLHHARGYGEPVGEAAVRLHPIEAAYLLYRGDIPPVDGVDFGGFVRAEAASGFLTRLLVYKDLRERGFYLAVAGEEAAPVDFAVFERGASPPDGNIGFHVRVLDERDAIKLSSLESGTLALVDGEGEVGYVDVARYTPHGQVRAPDVSGIEADVLGERVLAWDPPLALYREHFFGQPLAGREDPEGVLQLSLVEAYYLAEEGVLALNPEVVREAGQRGKPPERFDARAATLRALRTSGAVAKTGFKFGADFRVYHAFAGVEDMGHSDVLVRVLPESVALAPADVALDVRLAHGVGKRMVFAIPKVTDGSIASWLSVTRKTP